MKILVFSDTHLRFPFEEKKFNFLKNVLQQVDRVIINGDFWEGYVINFEQFINSPWNKLFPTLKSKKTIYIFGNHDKKILGNGKVNLFSDIQTTRYEITINNKKFIFEHGNKLQLALDDQLKLKKVPTLIEKPLLKFHDLYQILLINY